MRSKHPLWMPPRLNRWHDPLIQEIWFPDRWRMVLTCLCLNLTTGRQVRNVLPELFTTWSSPSKLREANEQQLRRVIQPLGLVNKRVYTFKRFSEEWLEKDWTRVKELYGCGKYAQESDDIFWSGEWNTFEPNDGELKRYLEFVRGELG